MCLLIGYGAGAINPYLAFETIDDMLRQGMLTGLDHKTAVKKFLAVVAEGNKAEAAKQLPEVQGLVDRGARMIPDRLLVLAISPCS